MLGFLSSLLGGASPNERRAREIADTVLHELTRMGFVYRRKDESLKRVRLEEPLLVTNEEVALPIDLRHLPDGKYSVDLMEEKVLLGLSHRVGAPVRWGELANKKQ